MDDEIELTRRRLLGGLVTAATASAAAGAGTMAYFSDTATSADNTVQAGTLELGLGEDGSATFLDESDIMPGDDGSADLELTNDGSVQGVLEVTIDTIRSSDKNENGAGDLEGFLELEAAVLDEQDDDEGQIIFGRQTVEDLQAEPISHDPIPLPSDGVKWFVLEWWLPDSAKNKAQGDSLEIDFTFRLDQAGGS